MKLFASEFLSNYGTYSFGYCNYAEPEDLSELGAIYDLGYLPYSGDPSLARDLFYMARSLRVRMERFSFSKKRRYLQRRLEVDHRLHLEVFEKEPFLRANGDIFRTCAFQWLEQRFEQAYLNTERLEYILAKPFLNKVMELRLDGEPAAYALLCTWPHGYHFWYSFYDSAKFADYSLGKWLMGHSLEWAKAQKLAFGYLGTAYHPKSDYKFHGTYGVEFFNGADWIHDREQLKARLAEDAAAVAPNADLFKQNR